MEHLAQGQLYVIGGSNGHSDELSCGERYDPQADEWIQVPELRTNRCNAGQWNQATSVRSRRTSFLFPCN